MAEPQIEGPYEAIRELGRGGMGVVHLVRESGRDQPVALKVLMTREYSENALRYFEQEFRILKDLVHPNLTEVHDFGRLSLDDGREVPFFTMRFVDGETLAEWSRDRGLDLPKLYRVIAQVGQALAYLHAKGFVHQDVKPSNILVARGDEDTPEVRLMDLGLAGRPAEGPGQGSLRGTAAYLAPEAARGGGAVDPRSDLYSLGCTLYEIVAGRPPFLGTSTLGVLRAHREEEPIPPSGLNRAVPPGLDELILKLLRKDPGLRFAGARPFLEALNQLAGGELDVETAEVRRGRVLGGGFFGRGAELRRLSEFVDDARRGVTHLVLVEGEAGMGKTRLLREFRIRCQLDGLDVHVGRADDVGRAVGALEDAVDRAVRTRGPLRAEVRDRFGDVLDDAFGRGEQPGPDPLRRFDALAAAVADLSRNAPVILALEDLHDADDTTCAEILHLARALSADRSAGGGVLLVGTYRGGEVSRSSPMFEFIAEAREAGILEELFLSPLGTGETRAMLRAMIGSEDIPEEFVSRLLEETRGNPLHLSEVVALLAEEGHIVPGTGDAPDPAALIGVEVPGRVRALLERRIAHVDPDRLRVLRAAAALDDPVVDFDAVAAISGLRWERVVERVLELSRTGLLARDDDDQGAPVYRFAHRGLLEIAAGSTPPDEAALLHAQAVSYLDRRGLPRRHGAWRAFARHAELAGQPGRAVEAYGRAGELARDEHAHREAVALLSRAIALATGPSVTSGGVLCELYLRRGQAFLQTGEVERAESDFRAMLERAERDGSDPLRSEAHLALGGTLATRGEDDEARDHLELALEIGERIDDVVIIGRARLELGRLATRAGDAADATLRFRSILDAPPRDHDAEIRIDAQLALGSLQRDQGDYRSALASFRSAEELAAGVPSPEIEVAIQDGAAIALEVQGDYRAALEALGRACDRARNRGDVRALAALTTRLGGVRLKTGDHAGADQAFHEALEIFRRLGSRDGMIENLRHLSRMHGHRGRYEAALDAGEEALRIARRGGTRSATAACVLRLGEILIALGDLPRAAERIDEAGRLMADVKNPRIQAARLLDLAELLRRRKDIEGARSVAQEAAFLARKVGDRRLEAVALCGLGEAHLAGAEYDRARIACKKGFALIEDGGLPMELADARLLRARIELESPGGDIVRAEQDAVLALESYRQLGEPDRVWQAEHLAARAGIRLGRGDDAYERIRRAHRFLERVRSRLGERWRTVFLDDPRRRELYDDWKRLRRPDAESDAAVPAVPPGELARWKNEAATLRRLLEISRELNSTRDTGALLHTVLDAAVEVTGAERGFLLLGDGTEISPSHARGIGGASLEGDDALAISRSIARRVMESGEPLLSTDAEADERFAKFESVQDLRIRSVIAVPLLIQDEVVGAVYLDHRLDRRLFSATDLEHAGRLADLAGLVLDSARMLEEIASQNERLARMNRELEKTVSSQRDEIAHMREELTSSRTSFELRFRFEDLVGASAPMQRLYHVIERLAPKRLPVLITGESGTGKELIARAMHAKSDRPDGPFFTVNCAALTETLLESELFGYRKGAFTGADRDKPGYFELAHGGTLFLDEIGEMGPSLQAKLLRVIERGEVLPVGGQAPMNVEVRIVSATHRDLPAMIRDGAFREDLYYRIHVGRVAVPPLRDRKDDIPLLVDHFLANLAAEEGRDKFDVEPAVLRLLGDLDWPGNVRELQHQILRVTTFAKGPVLTVRDFVRYGDLPEDAGVRGDAAGGDPGASGKLESLEEVEKRQILRALERAGGNKTRAAEILGINRATLFRKIKRLDLGV